MKCPKKIKHCDPQQVVKAGKDNYICCGRNTNPHFKCDNLKLCGKGIASEFALELTEDEAALFNIVLSTGIYGILQERGSK